MLANCVWGLFAQSSFFQETVAGEISAVLNSTAFCRFSRHALGGHFQGLFRRGRLQGPLDVGFRYLRSPMWSMEVLRMIVFDVSDELQEFGQYLKGYLGKFQGLRLHIPLDVVFRELDWLDSGSAQAGRGAAWAVQHATL